MPALGIGLRAILQADAAVTAEIGDPVRFFPNVARQNVSQPYVVYTIVDGEQVQDLNAHSGLAWAVFQVDVFDDEYIDAHDAIEVIRLAFQDFVGNSGGITFQDCYMYGGLSDEHGNLQDGRETKVHRVSMDFKCWYVQAVPA